MKARKNRAFFVETLIITFLLLLMLTILVRIFGAARRTKAAMAAQNVVTMFEAGEGEIAQAQQSLIDTANDEYSDEDTPQTTITLYFDEQGNQADDGVFQVTLFMTCEVRAVGYLITGNMEIVHVNNPEEDLAQLDTAIYFPDSTEDLLASEGVIDFDSIAEIETENEAVDSDQTEAES